MAYVAASSASSADATATITVVLPPHVTNDVLVISYDSRYGGTITDPTGWTLLTLNDASSSIGRVYYKVALSNAEANPTITGTGTQSSVATCDAIRDVELVGGVPTFAYAQAYANISKVIFPSVTLPDTNCLMLLLNNVQSDYDQTYFEPSIITNVASWKSTHAYTQSGHTYYQGITSPSYEAWQESDGNFPSGAVTVAFKDNGNNTNRGYMDSVSKPAILFHPLTSTAKAAHIARIGDVNVNPLIPSIVNSNSGVTTTTRDEAFGKGIALTNNPYIDSTYLASSSTDAPNAEIKGSQLTNTVDLSNEILAFRVGGTLSLDTMDNVGRFIGLSDGTNAKVWSTDALDSVVNISTGSKTCVVQPSAGTELASYGALDLTAIHTLITGWKPLDYTSEYQYFAHFYLQRTGVMLGGTSVTPCSFDTANRAVKSGGLNTVENQSSQTKGQFFVMQSLQIGDAVSQTNWVSSNQSVEFPSAYDYQGKFIQNQLLAGALALTVKASSSDNIDLSSTTINFGNHHKFILDVNTSQTATYDLKGLSVLNATPVLNSTGYNISGMTLSGCKEIAYTTLANLSDGNTISNCVDPQAITVSSEEDFAKLANCTFNGNQTAIKITGNTHTGSWSDPNITMSGNTVIDIEYTGTATFSIQSALPMSVSNTGGGSLTVITPTVDTGLDFTGLQIGSQVVIYQGGTTTEIQRNDSTTNQETWSELYSADQLVDYTILKAGFDPIRVVGITASDSVQTIAVQQKIARAYQAGLTFIYGTDGAYDTTTKVFTVTKPLTVQQYYSCMIDAFIAQTSLRNVEFCITPNGSNSFSFDDCTFEPTDITFLYRDGMRETVSGTTTRKWSAVWSSGDVGTDVAEIQQAAGAAPSKGWNAPNQTASGNVDMLLKVFDSALSIDYQSYLVIEYAKAGKYQGRIVAHDVYPTIEDDLYVVAVEPTSSPITAADPGLANPPTIIIEAAPVLWNGKNFSITITDSVAGNTGDAIAQWINWNIREEADAVFQGQDPMNWYDMIVDNATSWETAQGSVLGSTQGTNAGVRVVLNDGTTEHPDFTRHQSNDGTYWVKPITAQGSITNIVAGSRVRIYNVTQATETFNDIVAGTSYSESYTDGTTYASGDIIKIYIAYQSGVTAKLLQTLTAVATSSGWSGLASQVDDSVYNTNGIDGLGVIGYGADYVADTDGLNIDIQVTGSTFNIKEGYAWYVYNLMSANGLALFANVMYAKDTGNYVLDTTVANVQLDNTGTQNLLETSNANLSRTDGTDPRRNPPSGQYGISMNTANVIVANVGGSALTASESAALSAIDGRTTSLTFTKANELDVNVQSMNDANVLGTGIDTDKWRGV